MPDPITLFLCGDVMTGRGVDQILPHPSDPRIHEPFVSDARDYVALAEAVNGPIPRPAGFGYVWGDALAEFDRVQPDVRIANLETAVTRSDDAWPGKSIHYRMDPRNVPCLGAARIDCCVLANNHVLDWGYAGLEETVTTLRAAGIATAGAGRDRPEAAAPAVLDIPGKGRVAVFSFGSQTSGIPRTWSASAGRAGVNLLPDLSAPTVRAIASQVRVVKGPGTVVVASIHWGGNWGHDIPGGQRDFAHALIDEAGIDVLHGHSSHHPKAIEIYRDRLILYGCGDLLDDYEGIGGYEEFRGELVLMYFPRLHPVTGELVGLVMTPGRIRRFRLGRASADEAGWLGELLDREGRRFGTRVRLTADNRLEMDPGDGRHRGDGRGRAAAGVATTAGPRPATSPDPRRHR
jgi:poly-gamma-glutamate synthesis protein (capsule biosynthesis protein)